MIEAFRKFSESWLARGFFLLLAITFLVMWGGGDWAGRLSSSGQWVVKIGPRTVNVRDFYIELNRTLQQLQMTTGQTIDEEEAKKMGVYAAVRERIISNNLLELEAERLGIVVTDEEVRDFIKSETLFHGKDGSFDKMRFETIIKRLGYEENSYVESLRNDLLRRKLFDAIGAGSRGPVSVALPLYSRAKEKRSISAVLLSTDSVKLDEAATEADLKKYYDDNKARMQAPEYRSISVLRLSQNKLMESVMIPKADIEQSFNHRAEEFRGKKFADVQESIAKDLKRSRTIEPFEQLINKAEDLLGQGKSIEDVAKELDLDIISYNGIDKDGRADPFNSEAKSLLGDEVRIASDAFMLDLEGISAAIDIGNGEVRFIRVDKVFEAGLRSFESVRKKLIDFWTLSKKMELLAKKADGVASELNRGALLEAVASKSSLRIIKASLTRQGINAPSVLSFSDQALHRIYNMSVNEAVAFPYKVSDDSAEFIVVRLNSRDVADPKQNKDEFMKFQEDLKVSFVDDIVTLYLYALRKKFTVEVNQRFFDVSQQSSKA